MAYGKVNIGGGGTGGIGRTMIISRSHEGNEAPLTMPIKLGYYQKILAGTDIANVSLKTAGVLVPTTKSIVDLDILQMNGNLLTSNTLYNVEIPVGAVKDTLGNILKGVYRYSFTTKTFNPIYYVTPEVTKASFDTILADVNKQGGTIYFSEGNFRDIAPILITHSDVSLIGEGNNTKIFCTVPKGVGDVGVIGSVGTTTNIIKNVTVENMVIDRSDSTGYIDIYLKYSENTIKDCIVQNNGNYGIYLSNSSNNTITGNTCQNNAVGLYLSTSSNNNTITRNAVQNNGNGIFVTTSSNNTIIGNTCQNNDGDGITLYTSSNNNTIIGNTVQNNGIDGIHLGDSSNSTVTGNACQNNGDYGISLYNSSNNTITGNTFQDNMSGGIWLINLSSNMNIVLANKYQSITNQGTGNIISQNITA